MESRKIKYHHCNSIYDKTKQCISINDDNNNYYYYKNNNNNNNNIYL